MAAIFPTIAAAAVTMMMMSVVSSYDDGGSGFCTGDENTARCSRSQLPVAHPMDAQLSICDVFYDRALSAASVCSHLNNTRVGYEDHSDVYCYFTCSLKKYCDHCYDKAFEWRMATDGSGCPGSDGAYISLSDCCCLKYETNTNFCGVLH